MPPKLTQKLWPSALATLLVGGLSVGLLAQDTLGAIGRLFGHTDTNSNLIVRIGTGTGTVQERRAIGSLYGKVDTNSNLYVTFDPATSPMPSVALTTAFAGTCTGANLNETDLLSYNIPANTLSANGRGVRITFWGSFAATANNKTVTLYWGAAGAVLTSGAQPINQGVWLFKGDILRSGASAEVAEATLNFSGTPSGTASVRGSSWAGTDAASNLINVKVTGTNGVAAAGDICGTALIVETIN
jgi:hypothetical protein